MLCDELYAVIIMADSVQPSTSAQMGRKREKTPSMWKKTIIKKKRDSGQECTSLNTRRVMPARTMGPPCSNDRLCGGGVAIVFAVFGVW